MIDYDRCAFLLGRVLIAATKTSVIPNSSVIPTCLACFLRLSRLEVFFCVDSFRAIPNSSVVPTCLVCFLLVMMAVPLFDGCSTTQFSALHPFFVSLKVILLHLYGARELPTMGPMASQRRFSW